MTMSAPMNEIDDLILLSKNANALILGGAAKEGGDIKVYRNSSGNIALSFDADATSDIVGLDLYAGVIVQNHLTIGQTTLNSVVTFASYGKSYINGIYFNTGNEIYTGSNNPLLTLNIPIIGTNSTDHSVKMQIDSNDIIVAKATGNGSGGITNPSIGLYGTTPVVQAAHIADPAESTAGNNAAIDAILVVLENIGILASS